MESTILVAPDISCEHCQHAIEGAIGKLEGVGKVDVDISDQIDSYQLRPAESHADKDRRDT